LEKVLMRLAQLGVSRQEAHERIRKVSLNAQDRRERGESVNLPSMLAEDVWFAPVTEYASNLVQNPMEFVGRCVEQVDEYLRDEFALALAPYPNALAPGTAVLDV